MLQSLTKTDLSQMGFMYFREMEVAGIEGCMVARSGYTGEDGFEIAVPPGSACVKVMGANPVQVIHDGGASTTTLKKSQECTLSEGDQINLVVEAAVAATGRSYEWSGNPCAYRVNFVQTSAATANARAPTRRSPRAPSRGRAY